MSGRKIEIESVDIKKQIGLAVDALTAVQPIAEKAGISTAPDKAYDEWEVIIQAIYDAFLIIPISEENIGFHKDDFKKVGFSLEDGDVVIAARASVGEVYLHDIRCDEDNVVSLYFLRLSHGEPNNQHKENLEHLSNFSVIKYRFI